MARVPDSVLEAAKLDGCKPFREIVQLILPLIWPTLSTLSYCRSRAFSRRADRFCFLLPTAMQVRRR
ncbi:MAG: hypothetical protein ACLUSP_09190 [Christensenellales bacterium]